MSFRLSRTVSTQEFACEKCGQLCRGIQSLSDHLYVHEIEEQFQRQPVPAEADQIYEMYNLQAGHEDDDLNERPLARGIFEQLPVRVFGANE